MLPVVSRIKAPALGEKEINQSPFFEILLFKSRLRFRNPPANLENSVNLFGEKGSDKRPFVNTVSRSNYLCEEEIGLWYETLYTTGWKFYPRGWFKPAFAELRMVITVHATVGLQRERFPDLLKPEQAREWVLLKYRQRYQLYNEMTLQRSGDDFQLMFHDPEWASRQAEQRDFLVERQNINGIPVFRARPEPDIVDFFTAFTPEDILQFSFKLKALTNLEADEKAAFIQKASVWVESIMQTLELDLETKKLTHSDTI